MDSQLAHRLHVSTTIDGYPAEMVLRVPQVLDELPLHLDPDVCAMDSALAQNAISLMLGAFVESVNGTLLTRDLRNTLCANPSSRAALLDLRQQLLDILRFEGRCFLGCPHCGNGESEIDLLGLAIGLHVCPWPLTDPSGRPAQPALSTLWRLGSRPTSVARSASVRLTLPSSRVGLEVPHSAGTFGDPLNVERDAAAWRKWGRDALPLEPTRGHWRYSNPGFRAILRAAVVLERLGTSTDVTPDTIEHLPIGDFHFVDALYYLLHNVDVQDATACSVTCPVCEGRFLAVR